MPFDFPQDPPVGTEVTGPNGAQYIWDGEVWKTLGGKITADVVVSDTPPANPLSGELWFDSVSLETYVWYIDPIGPTGQWVPANSGTVQKISTGIGLTGGPITTTGTISLAPIAGLTAGSYTNTNLTVNAEGQITNASNGAPGSGGGIGEAPTTGSLYLRNGQTAQWVVNTNATVTLAGDVTGSGTTTITTTMASIGTAGTYAAPASITTDAKGRVTAVTAGTAVTPSTTLPLMDAATAQIGTGTTYTRADHVHPTDTSLAPLANPHFTNGVFETATAMAAAAIDLNTGSLFSKTISAATTLTVANVPLAGQVGSFILELTNAGTNITWFANIHWPGASVPTLSTTGTDVLGFYTRNAGASWMGLLLGKGMA